LRGKDIIFCVPHFVAKSIFNLCKKSKFRNLSREKLLAKKNNCNIFLANTICSFNMVAVSAGLFLSIKFLQMGRDA
jgi:hypothetical protein